MADEENKQQEEQTPEAAVGDQAADAEAAAKPVPAEEPAEQLGPKERRRRSRSAHTGENRPRRSADDRARERAEARRQKAAGRRRWRVRQREKRRARPRQEPPAPVERARARPRVRQGVVVSDRADKTITVRIDSARPHRTYGKIVRTSATLHAHDEANDAHAGDTVRIVETRPMSRSKRWRLVDVLERAR